MEKDESENMRKDLMTLLDRAHQGTVISKAMNTTGPTREKAEKERDKYSIEGLTKDEFADGKPRYTPEEFGKLTDDDKKQRIAESLEYRRTKSRSKGTEILANNLENILKKDDKWDSDLKNVSNVGEVVDNTPEEYKGVVMGYSEIIRYEKLAKDKADGKALSGEDEKVSRDLVSAAAQQKYLESKDNATLPENTRKLGAQIASLAPSETYTADQLKAGVKIITDRLKANLKSKFGDNYESKVTEGVAKAMGRLLNSGDEEKQQAATTIYYLAKKGYQIGGRDFPDEFKKKD